MSSQGERFTFNLQRPVHGVRLVGGDVGAPLWEESSEQDVPEQGWPAVGVVAAVAQVADHEKIKVIKRLYHEVYKFPGRRKSTQHSRKRGADFDMVRHVLIDCNKNSCSPGYQSMLDQRHGNQKKGVLASGLLPSAKTPLEKLVHELRARVWEVVVGKFPFMAKYR
ncbi:hypothetical protein HYH03_010680 [Edaphochlamys debaryana]|uniref:Uncharacterized protein n=1 Tax=Edaphochlamys debaryana TaxID=47281 RepID=A0A836BXA3_9CHLO|nr:hypothetical protein HYH03_010680 [Edaphochlamys debaryana]|eukprot:KAG2491008.1 hypothetical protein HYH03_010680 [Edaphochlamys debaryana]